MSEQARNANDGEEIDRSGAPSQDRTISTRTALDLEVIPGVTAPISWGVTWGDLLFMSGVHGQNCETKEWGDIAEQVEICLGHIERIALHANSSLDNLLTVTTYLSSRDDFAVYDKVYGQVLGCSPPARTTIVSDFVIPGMLVEITCTAGIGRG